jgi:biopolymer transport protein ExbD
MAPLIDMVFILLIFFLVTTSFVRETGVEVDRPQAAAGQPIDSQSMRISIAASGAVYTEGERVELPVLAEKVRQFLVRERNPSVVIIPDTNVSAGRLVEVMDVAKLAGVKNVAVATREK